MYKEQEDSSEVEGDTKKNETKRAHDHDQHHHHLHHHQQHEHVSHESSQSRTFSLERSLSRKFPFDMFSKEIESGAEKVEKSTDKTVEEMDGAEDQAEEA